MRGNNTTVISVLTIALLGPSGMSSALAQEGIVLEEITVTAQRREEPWHRSCSTDSRRRRT